MLILTPGAATLDQLATLWRSGAPARLDPTAHEGIARSAGRIAAAVAGETHEYTDMYPGMAKTARDEGFDEIADWFETLAKAERSHANRYQKALDALVD